MENKKNGNYFYTGFAAIIIVSIIFFLGIVIIAASVYLIVESWPNNMAMVFIAMASIGIAFNFLIIYAVSDFFKDGSTALSISCQTSYLVNYFILGSLAAASVFFVGDLF